MIALLTNPAHPKNAKDDHSRMLNKSQLMILSGILFCDSMAATLSAGLLYRRFFTGAWQLNRAELRRIAGSSG